LLTDDGGLDGEEKETQWNAGERLRSVRRYTRLTPHLVVCREDTLDPSLVRPTVKFRRRFKRKTARATRQRLFHARRDKAL